MSIKPNNPNRQGWRQFLTARTTMLSEFDRAKEKDQTHKISTYRGKVAESQFRKWLTDFLPMRYGVTSGYIISQGRDDSTPTPHFDVIIFEQFESPTLWIEENPDTTSAGSSRAIPAEYVRAVIEVKSSLNATSAGEAFSHISELVPLLRSTDGPNE